MHMSCCVVSFQERLLLKTHLTLAWACIHVCTVHVNSESKVSYNWLAEEAYKIARL